MSGCERMSTPDAMVPVLKVPGMLTNMVPAEQVPNFQPGT